MPAKILKDNGDHFLAQGPGGSQFKIAKHGLGPHVLKTYVKMAGGGDPVTAQNEEDDTAAVVNNTPAGMQPQAWADDQRAMKANGLKPEDAEKAGFAPENFRAVSPPGDTGRVTDASIFSPAGASTQKLPDQPPVDPNASASGATFPTPPVMQAPKLAGDSDAEAYDRAQAKAQNQALADATTEGNKQRASVDDQKMAWENDYKAKFDEDYKRINDEGNELRKQIGDGKIDPNHFWHEAGTGGKVAAGIGMLLSGFGVGKMAAAHMSAGNAAMKVIQDGIDRDIDAQKANLETKKSLLQDNYRRTGDLRLALAETRQHYNAIAAGMMDKIGSTQNSAEVQQRLGMANTAIQMHADQGAREIANVNATNSANAGNQNRMLKFQGEMAQAKAAGDAAAAGKIPRESQGRYIGNLNAVLKDVDTLTDHNDKTGINGLEGGILDRLGADSVSPDLAKSKGMSGALIEKAAAALSGMGASQERIEALSGFHINPWDRREVQHAKAEGLKQYIKTQVDEYTKQQASVGYRTGPAAAPQGPKGDQ